MARGQRRERRQRRLITPRPTQSHISTPLMSDGYPDRRKQYIKRKQYINGEDLLNV
jgi:hypothetical protein